MGYGGGLGATYGSGYGGAYGSGFTGGYGSGYGGGLGYGGGMYGRSSFGLARGGSSDLETSSRNAFSSVERIVSAFVSVAQMLESTYEAMFSSFRAVLGVAEQFGHLKGHLLSVVSALALFRWLRRMVGKALQAMGLTPPPFLNPATLDLTDANFDLETSPHDRARTWPFVVFFAVAIGGPYLIWRFLIAPETARAAENADRRKPVRVKAVWDFDASRSDELSFRTGDILTVHPPGVADSREWLMAEFDGKRGLVPANYIRLIRGQESHPSGNEPFDENFHVERPRAKNSRGEPDA